MEQWWVVGIVTKQEYGDPGVMGELQNPSESFNFILTDSNSHFATSRP